MRLFQIYYNEETKLTLDAGFTALDNTHPEYPDLYEYSPIRSVLLNFEFQDDEYLGFFSPRLNEKTNLTSNDIIKIANQSKSEVISFSPFFEEIACYPNSFIQGDIAHPGLRSLAQGLLDDLGININLLTLVQDQTRIIYSNYFIARYRFWKEWFQLTEHVFEISKNHQSTLAKSLNTCTKHRTNANYSMKIFIIERMISILLEMKKINAEIGINMDRIPISWPHGSTIFPAFLSLDALKGHFIKTKLAMYLSYYEEHRQQVLRLLTLDKR